LGNKATHADQIIRCGYATPFVVDTRGENDQQTDMLSVSITQFLQLLTCHSFFKKTTTKIL
jgi:hypothetical protein